MNSELMMYVHPQEFPVEKLLESLNEYGLSVTFLENGKDKFGKVVSCFYENLASLPRRHPRNNRRGAAIIKKHKIEDQQMLLTMRNLNLNNTSNTFSTVKSESNLTHKRNHHKASTDVIQSTSEMDRLQARSKTALTTKRQLKEIEVSTKVPAQKVIKFNHSSNTNCDDSNKTRLLPVSQVKTKTCLILNKRLKDDSPSSHIPSKKILLNTDLSNHTTSSRALDDVSLQSKKPPHCNENDLNKNVIHSKPPQSGRRKLKRPSFT